MVASEQKRKTCGISGGIDMIQAKTFEQKLKIVASRLLLAFIIASLMMTPQIGQSTVTATAKPAKPIQLYLDGRASVAPVPPQMLNNTV